MSDDDSSSSSGSDSEPPIVEPPKKKARTAKAKNTGPKKPLSAYMFFCKDNRALLKQENPTSTFGELGKLLGTKWKEMEDDDKGDYNAQAAADKVRYANEGGGPAAKAAGGGRKKKERVGPKRPLSAYMYFSQDVRPKIKEGNPALSFAELGREIGAAWKIITTTDRAKFDKMAAKDKQRYKDEVAGVAAAKEAPEPVEEEEAAADSAGSESDGDGDASASESD